MNNAGKLFAGLLLETILQESRIRNQNTASKRDIDPGFAQYAENFNDSEDKLRSTGRTTNQALNYARIAIDQAGSPVIIRDHFPSIKAHGELTEKVSRILSILNVAHSAVGTTILVEPLVKPEPVAPLPEWASAANPNHLLGEATQLLTKDGRKIGNAFIVAMPDPFVKTDTYCIDTDNGSHVHMTEDEIHEHFYIGDFYGKIDELLEQHKR